MGLDIYLYRYEDREASDKLDALLDKLTDKALKQAGGDRDEYVRLSDEIYKKHGVTDGCGCDTPLKKCIEEPSKLHPEHLFKVGYFRSSYNHGGINYLMREHIKTDLGAIMGFADEYCFQPDWALSKQRALDAMAELRALDAKTKFRAIEIDVFNPFSAPPTVTNGAEAVAAAQPVIEDAMKPGKEHPFGNDFANSTGLFLLTSQPKCLAFVAACDDFMGRNTPKIFAIVEAKPGDVFGWSIQALEIVVETCDYVLASGETNKYFLHWSG